VRCRGKDFFLKKKTETNRGDRRKHGFARDQKPKRRKTKKGDGEKLERYYHSTKSRGQEKLSKDTGKRFPRGGNHQPATLTNVKLQKKRSGEYCEVG